MKMEKMPIGLTMALAQNLDALEKFALLSENEKEGIIKGAHSVSSKEEMRQYVDVILSKY